MTQQQSWVTIAVYFGIFLIIFYLLVVLPRKKQEKKHNEVINNLKRGDKVVTIGGIRGEVVRIKDETVVIKVSENSEIEFIKNAIAYPVGDK